MELIILIIIAFIVVKLFTGNSKKSTNTNNGDTNRNSRLPEPTYYNDNTRLTKKEEEQLRTERWRSELARAEQQRQEQKKQALEQEALAEKQKWATLRANVKTTVQEASEHLKRQEEARAEQRRREEALAEQQRRAQALAEQRRQEQALAEQHRQEQALAEQNLYETKTNYYSQVFNSFNRNTIGFSFETIRVLSKKHDVFEELDNGVAQLNSNEQLQQYMFSYGKMHHAKLSQAFNTLHSKHDLMLTGQSIEIIDYGCGQGIGTVCFIDFLKSIPSFKYTIKRVKLIEPSNLALKRAALHVKYSLKSARQSEVVQSINEELDDVTEHQLGGEKNTIKFHIFSNILDVTEFNLEEFTDKLTNTIIGENYFICVSPNMYSDGSHFRNRRLQWFMNYFIDAFKTTVISERISDIPKPNGGGTWTRYEKIFKVDFDEVIHNTTNSSSYISSLDESDDLPF
jgi:hypothetical protein